MKIGENMFFIFSTQDWSLVGPTLSAFFFYLTFLRALTFGILLTITNLLGVERKQEETDKKRYMNEVG